MRSSLATVVSADKAAHAAVVSVSSGAPSLRSSSASVVLLARDLEGKIERGVLAATSLGSWQVVAWLMGESSVAPITREAVERRAGVFAIPSLREGVDRCGGVPAIPSPREAVEHRAGVSAIPSPREAVECCAGVSVIPSPREAVERRAGVDGHLDASNGRWFGRCGNDSGD